MARTLIKSKVIRVSEMQFKTQQTMKKIILKFLILGAISSPFFMPEHFIYKTKPSNSEFTDVAFFVLSCSTYTGILFMMYGIGIFVDNMFKK